jgi:hypothetical protein
MAQASVERTTRGLATTSAWEKGRSWQLALGLAQVERNTICYIADAKVERNTLSYTVISAWVKGRVRKLAVGSLSTMAHAKVERGLAEISA